jgi:hypothetical protein
LRARAFGCAQRGGVRENSMAVRSSGVIDAAATTARRRQGCEPSARHRARTRWHIPHRHRPASSSHGIVIAPDRQRSGPFARRTIALDAAAKNRGLAKEKARREPGLSGRWRRGRKAAPGSRADYCASLAIWWFRRDTFRLALFL